MNENVGVVQVLPARVSKLEGQARRWRALSVFMVLAVLLLVWVGVSRSETPAAIVIRAKTVEAQDLVLKDKNGRVRARLSSDPTEKEEITLQGKVYHAQLPREPALQVFDDNGDEV
jgi:hypothetical protein